MLDKFEEVSNDKWAIKSGEKIGSIHGKTYHFGRINWLKYLREMNPTAYKPRNGMNRTRTNQKKMGIMGSLLS